MTSADIAPFLGDFHTFACDWSADSIISELTKRGDFHTFACGWSADAIISEAGLPDAQQVAA